MIAYDLFAEIVINILSNFSKSIEGEKLINKDVSQSNDWYNSFWIEQKSNLTDTPFDLAKRYGWYLLNFHVD